MGELQDQLSGDQLRYLQFIRSNAQGMQELVDGLLAFARLGRRAMDLQPISTHEVVDQALSAPRREA